MTWRRRIGIVVWGLASVGTTLTAQDDLDVFSDTPLPSILSDDSLPDASLPNVDSSADEELPPAEPSTPAPRIDPSADEEALPEGFSAEPFEGRFGNPARSEQAPAYDSEAPGAAVRNSAESAPLDDAEMWDDADAEILPQETIRERYGDGQIKIERGVAQDDNENYVNHGPWRMWDEAGNLIAEGTYRFGKRHGKWLRWYQATDAELFSLPPFNLFTAPFLSTAVFREGELDGHWVISDSAELKIVDWEFAATRREGESIWYYHTGRKMRVIHYRDGQIHGDLLEWDVNGEQVTRVAYEQGRRLEKTVETYEDGQKKVEGTVLQARLVMKEPDDWWEAKLATYARQGKDQKHGAWTAWYPNGQMKFTGEYRLDRPAGDFTWWFVNGQKSLEAHYEDGKKTGEWNWWHENGQKSIQGSYQSDSPVGRWVWWHETGKVAQRIDFSGASENMVGLPTDGSESILLRQPQNDYRGGR